MNDRIVIVRSDLSMTKLATPLKKQELVGTFMRETILAAAKKVLAANP